MGSHGPSFDAFGAISSVNPYALTKAERTERGGAAVGMHAMGLYAAVGTLAALIRARATGVGALVEVAAADCAAHWLPDGIDAELNKDKCFDRPGFLGGQGKQAYWPRLWRYECQDGRGMFFQALGAKFWDRFCGAVDRPDLAAAYGDGRDVNDIDEDVHTALAELFATRSFADWMTLFGEHDIPAGAANSRDTLVHDPHFQARHNVYEVELPGAGTLHLTTTPIKVEGQDFAPTIAPRPGQDGKRILTDLVGLSAERLDQLREQNAIG